MSQPFSLDRLNSVNPGKTGQAALAAVEAMRRFTTEQQIAGLTVAYALLLAKHGVHPNKAQEVARNLLRVARDETVELRAVTKFVNGEL